MMFIYHYCITLFGPCMIGDDEQVTQQRLTALHTNGIWECIECLSNSFQRVRMLAALTDTHTDLRDLKDELDLSRTALQRNLSLLEQHYWIKEVSSGYTTTTEGRFIMSEFCKLLERIQRIESLTPFLAEVEQPTTVNIDRFDEFLVTVPKPHHPHLPLTRLVDLFDAADQVQALFPVISRLLVAQYYQRARTINNFELVIPQDEFYEYCRAKSEGWSDEIEMDRSTYTTIHIYEGEIPYGLFIFGDGLALAAYDDLGRIVALVESESEETIEWGKQVYASYKCQSRQVHGVGPTNGGVNNGNMEE